MPEAIEIPLGFQKAIAKEDSLRPTPSDLAAAIPDEFAVETIVPARGVNWPARKRIDYKGIRLRNADGTPNKIAKNLVELHRPAARYGADIIPKLQAGDYNRAEVVVEELLPYDEATATRWAAVSGLRPLRRGGEWLTGCYRRPERNLWWDGEALVRMAFVGSPTNRRIVVYRA